MLTGFILTLWIRYLARRRQRRLLRGLEGLDDATLRDLALTHGELGSWAAEQARLAPATRRRVRAGSHEQSPVL